MTTSDAEFLHPRSTCRNLKPAVKHIGDQLSPTAIIIGRFAPALQRVLSGVAM